MKQGPDQIALPARLAAERGDARFIVTDANRAAFDHFRKFSMWPVKATILTGPAASGRTVARTKLHRARRRPPLRRGRAARRRGAVPRLESGAGHRATAGVRSPTSVPPDWAPHLPICRTRLAVTPVTGSVDPDDALFVALIQLHFADRGLHVPREALRFMSERLHRDYWTVERAVEAVDRFAIAERARVRLPTSVAR